MISPWSLASSPLERSTCLDLLVDVPFFVGQEEVVVAAAADERFLFQPSQAFLDAAAQGQPVAVDLVEAEGHEVVHVPLHLVHIPDEEENLEQLDVERLQAGVRLGLVDGLLDRRIEEALDGRVEVVQRHQDADFVDRDGLRRRLEGVEHRPLATGQVHTRGPGLADRLEDFLDQLELVRGEGVVLDEILAVLELAERHAAVLEGELVLEDVALAA